MAIIIIIKWACSLRKRVHAIFNHIFFVIGVTVLVDSKALITVLGSEMDYIQNKLSSSFVFSNPNVKETCGCGESFKI